MGFCYLSFLPKFNYPTLISLTASNDVAMVASVVNSVLTPSISHHYVSKHFSNTLYERLENYVYQITDHFIRDWYLYPEMDKILKDVGHLDIPSLNELRTRYELVLFNHDPVVDTAEQFPPNVIGVGGLQIKPPKPLAEVRLFKKIYIKHIIPTYC